MRKIRRFLAMAAIAALGLTLMSCGGETAPETSDSAAAEIAGSYTGTFVINVMGTEFEYEGKTVTITGQDDGRAAISIPPLGGDAHMTIPGLSIGDLEVAGRGGSCAIEATEFEGVAEGGKNYSGVIAATCEKGTLTLNMSLQYGAMPMPLVCRFSAARAE